jgi:hypothetical protein
MTSAIGEISDGQLTGYTALLAVAGVLMLVLAATGFGRQTSGQRLLNGLFGLGFVGYAFYLFFIFDGGTVIILWYVFILPVLLIVQAVRRAFARS